MAKKPPSNITSLLTLFSIVFLFVSLVSALTVLHSLIYTVHILQLFATLEFDKQYVHFNF